MKTKFIPIDYSYFDFNDKNHIKIYGRDDKGKKICLIDSCDIYLWAILKDNLTDKKINSLIKKIKKIKINSKTRKTKIEKVEIHNKKFLDEDVKALKIFATNYKDLKDIADNLGFPEIEKRRGYDLGFVTHYIIEKKIKPFYWYEIEGDLITSSENSKEFGGIDSSLNVDFCIRNKQSKEISDSVKKFKPKILGYDIETDEIKIGEGEILMISLVGDNFKKVITWKKSDSEKIEDIQDYVEFVKDEKELLERFSKYIQEISPDFLIGYFSDGFDLPYLKARADKNRIKLELGIDNSSPKFSRGRELTGKIEGISHIDLLKFIKTAYAQYMKSETLSLNEVSKEFLGDTKKEFKIEHSSKLTEKKWKDYYEYNLHDSQLVCNLFEKFWPDLLEFSRVVQEPVFDLSRAGLSKFTESYILHNLERFNEIPEKRPTYDDIGERRALGGVEGAFVLEPIPGLYEKIVAFDFTSMHTSIIISYNLSKSTLLEKKPSNKKDCYEIPELELNKEKRKFYFTQKPGFFPELMKEIFNLRKQFKEKYKKEPNPITLARSNAFKVLSASAHGYMGFFGARYYSKEAAASVLALVRQLNKQTIEKTNKKSFEVIYADTDSCIFQQKNKTKKQVMDFLKELNSELPGVMELELEGFFKRGLWVTTRAGNIGAKKKYALIDDKNELKIRGFETVRRDWCYLSRKLQDKVLRKILEDGNEKRALEYVKKIVKKIKNREIPKEDLLIKTQLKKPLSEYKAISPHVIAAKKMKEKKIPVKQGNLIMYYISESKEKKALVRERVKLPEEPGKYDIEYYLNKQVLPAIENIFHVFNIEVSDFLKDHKQDKLKKWF